MKRFALFAGIAAVTACSLLATAQPRKSKPAAKAEAGVLDTKADTAPVRDGGADRTSVVDQKQGDGGSRVFRFGEVEVEGRLKSPQIVYFLRRVRAEFAAGDLGHRSFIRELEETKTEPGF